MMTQDSKPSVTRTYRVKKKRAVYVDTVTPVTVDPSSVPASAFTPEEVEEVLDSHIVDSVQSEQQSDVESVIQSDSDLLNEPQVESVPAIQVNTNDELMNDDSIDDSIDLDLTEDEYNYLLESIPQPDSWVISSPLDKKLPDLLNFMSKGEIIAVLTLSDDNMKALIPTLRNYYTDENVAPQKPFYLRVWNWWKKHKIIGSFAGVLIGIVIVNIIAGIVISGVW